MVLMVLNILHYLLYSQVFILLMLVLCFRSNTLWYMAMMQSSVFMITLQSVFVNIPQKTLPFPAWLPYNYSKTGIYAISYTHQIIGNATSAILHVANDTLISGIMLQICAQLELLKHRISKLPSIVQKLKSVKAASVNNTVKSKESELLGDIIKHHNNIFQLSITIYLS